MRLPLEPSFGRLPFLHAVAELEDEWPPPAASLLATYHRLWRGCGFELNGEHQPAPYNLLLTRQRMWLVPRSQERCVGVEVYDLGFAGVLLATDPRQAALTERTQPLTVLQRVTQMESLWP